MAEVTKLILLFFLYSVVGWLWETVYCSIKAGKYVYRGFMVGPYCPIYGFGILGVLYFVEPYQSNLVVLYIFATILVTVLEYLTSFILEKLFHTTWWDYKDVPLNLHGRIALPVSLFWGIACVFIVKVVEPQMLRLETFLAAHFGIILPIIIVIGMSFDLIYTIVNMKAFQKAAQETSEAIARKKLDLENRGAAALEELGEKSADLREAAANNLQRMADKRSTVLRQGEAWLEAFRNDKEARRQLPRFGFNGRRYLRNFKNMNFKDINNTAELRKLFEELQKEHKKNQSE